MKWRQTINRFLEALLILLMILLLGDVLLQVLGRYLFKGAFTFTDELAGYLLIWVGMLGAAYVSGKGQHLAITWLSNKLSPPLRRMTGIFSHLLIFFFAFFVMIIGGIWLVYTRFELGQTSASLGINLGYVYAVLPLAGIFICLFHLDELFKKEVSK